MERTAGYFFVRAMGQSEAEFAVFFDKGVVAVGWSAIDFTAYPIPDSVAAAVEAHYYPPGTEVAATVRGKKLAEVQRFKSMRPGDRVLVPYSSSIRLATAKGQQRHEVDDGKRFDLANQREVEYVRGSDGTPVTIPRTALSEGLQRRLRVRGTTVSDLVEFAEEIEQLFNVDGGGWSTRVHHATEEQAKRFKSELLSNIHGGRTNLKAGGRGLEELVRDLLGVEGYEARIPSKRAFDGFGDADVIAIRADRFEESKLLVQVKHHRGTSDSYGAEQLLQIIRDRPEEYEDYQLVFVTTAAASPELAAICEQRGVMLVPGSELIDWVFESLEDLPPEWRTVLGISRVPRFAIR